LLHLDNVDGEPTDETGRSWEFAVEGAAISDVKKKFGAGSLEPFGSNSEGIKTGPSDDFNFGTGDFEFEFYLDDVSRGVLSSDGSFELEYRDTMGEAPHYFRFKDLVTGEKINSDAYEIVGGTWILLTVNRISGVIHFYVDGVSYGGGAFAYSIGGAQGTAGLFFPMPTLF